MVEEKRGTDTIAGRKIKWEERRMTLDQEKNYLAKLDDLINNGPNQKLDITGAIEVEGNDLYVFHYSEREEKKGYARSGRCFGCNYSPMEGLLEYIEQEGIDLSDKTLHFLDSASGIHGECTERNGEYMEGLLAANPPKAICKVYDSSGLYWKDLGLVNKLTGEPIRHKYFFIEVQPES